MRTVRNGECRDRRERASGAAEQVVAPARSSRSRGGGWEKSEGPHSLLVGPRSRRPHRRVDVRALESTSTRVPESQRRRAWENFPVLSRLFASVAVHALAPAVRTDCLPPAGRVHRRILSFIFFFFSTPVEKPVEALLPLLACCVLPAGACSSLSGIPALSPRVLFQASLSLKMCRTVFGACVTCRHVVETVTFSGWLLHLQVAGAQTSARSRCVYGATSSDSCAEYAVKSNLVFHGVKMVAA